MATTTILVVEDEILVGEEIREDLERAGYCVPDVVTSGDEVLNSVSRYKPDLILMDVRLEGEIDGIEAAQQIKAIQNIPIIFLTAYSDPVTLTRAADTSPSAYLLKPFSIRELTANVSMALAKSQKKQSDELSHTGPILNALDIPAFLLDSNGRVQQANPAVLSLLNVDGLARVQGESITHYLRTEMKGKRERHILITANGAELDVIPSFETITSPEGRNIGTLVVIDRMSRKERKHLEKSAAAANAAVVSLLPGRDAAGEGYSISGLFIPSPSGSGDVYDVFLIDHDHFAFYSLDVMGHGTLAALIAFSLHNTIRMLALAEPGNFQPKELISRLNERYIENDAWAPFFSILYGVVERSTGIYRFIRAGHTPLIHMRANGSAQMLSPPGTALGVFKDIGITEGKAIIDRGDRLILCSDGLAEVFGGGISGSEGLLKAVKEWGGESRSGVSLPDYLCSYTGNKVQDDISLLMVTRNP